MKTKQSNENDKQEYYLKPTGRIVLDSPDLLEVINGGMREGIDLNDLLFNGSGRYTGY